MTTVRGGVPISDSRVCEWQATVIITIFNMLELLKKFINNKYSRPRTYGVRDPLVPW